MVTTVDNYVSYSVAVELFHQLQRVNKCTEFALIRLPTSSKTLSNGVILHTGKIIHPKLPETHHKSSKPTTQFRNAIQRPQTSVSDAHINYLCKNGRLNEAIESLESSNYGASARGNSGDGETGRLIHGMVIKCGMTFQVRVNNAILAVYGKCRCLDLARRFFDSMEFRDTVSWNAMITGYCNAGNISEAQRLFNSMRDQGFEPGLVTWNILIASYSQLGELDMVMELMKEMESYRILPDIFTWTSMISGFAQSNRKSQAWDFFELMIAAGVQPNEITLISLISTCASLKDLKKGRELHAWAVKEGFGDNVLVANSLVDMYSKCAKLEDALLVFDNLSARDVYTWNSMIGGYCLGGYCGQANNLFLKMQESDVRPNVVTWNTMIAGYMQNGDEGQALELFHKMEKDGQTKPDTASWNTLIGGYVQNGDKDKGFWINLDSELSVSNSLVDTFAKSGNIEYSIAVFNSLLRKDIISWNTLIAAYVIHGRPSDAIELFAQMKTTAISPNRGTFASMISAYGLAGMFDEGNHLFSEMIRDCDISPDLDHYAAMVNLCGRCGKLEEAVEVINNMTIEPNSSIWAALLTGSSVQGNTKLAIYAAERLLQLEPEDAVINRLVLQLYGLCGIAQGSVASQKFKKRKDSEEAHGWGWIRDKNTVRLFVGGNCSKQISGVMDTWIDRMGIKRRRSDYSDWLPIEEDESEETNGIHSEKLAFAFALSKATGASRPVRVVKNGRMCKEMVTVLAKIIGRPGKNQPLFSSVDTQLYFQATPRDGMKRSTRRGFIYKHHKSSKKTSLQLLSEDSTVVQFFLKMDYGKSHTISVGPWGGQDGYHWDDGVYTGIRQLVISHGAGIDAIQIEYDRNGTSVWSDKHGGSGGTNIDKVRLDYPDEFLTSIHGYYGSLHERGPAFVRSLAFESNKRTLGRYGIEQGTYFSFPMTQGKIVGFHGKCGWYLDAIGVYLEPITSTKLIIPSNSLVHSQRSAFQGVEKFEYSMLQGNGYDLILAVRHKERYYNGNYTPDHLSRQRQTSDSREFSRAQSQNKLVNAAPAKIEKVASRNSQDVVTYGPWGGNGGSLFDDGVYDGIKEIHLSRNVGIVSIRVCYDLNGQPEWGDKNGGTGGFKSDRVTSLLAGHFFQFLFVKQPLAMMKHLLKLLQIVFDYPSEILTHITGYYGPAMGMGPNIIKSLTFYTTKGKYGPYGDEQGQPFSTKLKEGAIVGFHGRKGLFVDAIGVHLLEGKALPVHVSNSTSNSIILKSLPNNTEVNNKPQWSFRLRKYGLMGEAVQKIVKDPAPFGPGPWGGEGGKPWDDGVFTGIKQIILTRTDAICSIEFEYDRNGQSVWSVKHGNSSGLPGNRIKLDYPHEVLIRISGYYSPLRNGQGTKVVKSLMFYTSRRNYGPFGEEVGQYFSSATTEGKVVGFHGRSGMYLDAIGVHMQHWLGNQRSPKLSLRNIFY
ncbi:OLC1v1018087C1 [Oldenlandia corymbosa var. corymbosa]|uniref:OLC1v1018087C1 n=1 Tax=Oldenlandia corymbosa var. corymbosa TaxID=529605 RepID=A0AAV1EAS8_OLDCO|nr:OLC1v1018087C1 [Oldenlandia corymbosa var. corymbosa]